MAQKGGERAMYSLAKNLSRRRPDQGSLCPDATKVEEHGKGRRETEQGQQIWGEGGRTLSDFLFCGVGDLE